jgi:hypothetical protein
MQSIIFLQLLPIAEFGSSFWSAFVGHAFVDSEEACDAN